MAKPSPKPRKKVTEVPKCYVYKNQTDSLGIENKSGSRGWVRIDLMEKSISLDACCEPILNYRAAMMLSDRLRTMAETIKPTRSNA